MQIFPNVAPILPPKGSIPNGYRLMTHKWSYGPERIGETVEINGERVKKMLTLDVNFPDDEFAKEVNAAPAGSKEAKARFKRGYFCIHKCPGCFDEAELENDLLTTDEVLDVIDQARDLGLESIKFLGPGELLMNSKLFEILDGLAKRRLVVGIFTKAALLGNDVLARRYQKMDSDELTRRLASYPNTTFLVGARSFNPERENRFVPWNFRELRDLREVREELDYHAARHVAIERLCALGMHTDLSHQRLNLVCSPVTAENVGDAFEIYRWGAERNIPVHMPPTMVSGKGHNFEEAARDPKFEQDYIDLAVDVYSWAIQRGVMSHEQLRREGVHPYIGVAPCNQLTHGLFVSYDGVVWRCPGNDTRDFIVDRDVRKSPLIDIWRGSPNYRIQAFNNGCVKDGISLPLRFYKEVPERVTARLAHRVHD